MRHSMNNFYVTTPIYYVNDRPHIGHAYTTILADVLAQYHRLMGDPTFFLTGSDEHGLKVHQAADQGGLTPQEQADRTVVRFQELWKKLEITHDDFIRTTEERHKTVVQKILQDLFDRGEIYKAEYDGWYDVGAEVFITEKELQDRGGPEANPNVTRVKESNYFFRMSKYQDWLLRYIEENPKFIQPDFRRNETLGFLRKPLQDLCISRPKSRLPWGIDLPFDDDFVCYVWFDALVNYISGVGYLEDDARFQKWWPASFHLIGKDILTTHTVYWPTMLQAMGLPMPETIFAHGWWLLGQSKMSKSVGNVVDPMDMIDRYGVDAVRYFLISEMTLGQDANFSEAGFIRRYNSDLANDLGNLLSRILNMISRYCDGKIPAPSGAALEDPDSDALWKTMQVATKDMLAGVEGMRLDQGVAAVIAAVRAMNRYLEAKQPWHLAKQEDLQPLHDVLYTAAETLRVAAALLHPIMPERMGILRMALGIADGKPDLDKVHTWGLLQPGAPIRTGDPLVPRIKVEDMKEEQPEKQEAAPPPKPKPAVADDTPGVITIKDVQKIELRTAIVLEAEKIEGAEKLLRLEVRMGEERRQIVAGIALHYEPDALIGRTVVVVANLKPAKLRGVESQGMLLAASKGEKLRLIAVDGEIASGAVVR